MILAAGFGKRMMPLTKDLPKPLISINGKTLLENSIIFLRKLGCKEIIINIHYQHLKIQKFINTMQKNDDIILIFEKEILDTGGGVKNAIPYFKYKNILIINSDVYWRHENLFDAKKIIISYFHKQKPFLLLVNKNNSYGLIKNKGDFNLKKNKVYRFKNEDDIYFYSGLQIFNLDILKNFSDKKFSFNKIWDYLILKEKLCGQIIQSKWYHVGDIKGLNIAKKLDS